MNNSGNQPDTPYLWHLIIAAVLLYSSVSLADNVPPLEILQADVDTVQKQVRLYGVNFDNGGPPVVTLGQLGSVAVSSYNHNEIVIQFSGPMPAAGAYRVFVNTGKGDQRADEFDLTISVADPGGPGGESEAGFLERSLYHSGTSGYVAEQVESEALYPICADGNGCTVRVVSQWRSNIDPIYDGYEAVFIFLWLRSDGLWSTENLGDGSFGNGNDQNSNVEVVGNGPGCGLWDSDSLISDPFSVVDDVPGFQLVGWLPSEFVYDFQCHLAVTD